MGPPPPRIHSETAEEPSEGEAVGAIINDPLHPSVPGVPPGEVVPAGLRDVETVRDEEQALAGAQWVATVNGSPIFASDILDRYGAQLKRLKAQVSPDEFRRIRESLIKRDLSNHVQRRLLADALKAQLSPEQVRMLNEQLDKAFESEIERLKKEFEVATLHELELVLQKQGTSLANLRNAFATQQMAREYLRMKAQAPPEFSRADLLAYYEAHRDEFRTPGKVKWQQIYVSFAEHGGKRRAWEVVEQVREALRRGERFEDVVRRYSDGPHAEEGGWWEARPGSLADRNVEKALAELPLGTISQVLEGSNAFRIVRVSERREAGYTPFSEVQDDIHERMLREAHRQALEKVINELLDDAEIVTIFDDRERSGSEPAGASR